MTARLLHEAEDLAETQSGALADAFGRKERIKGSGDGHRIHPGARIGNRHHDVLARAHLDVLCSVGLVEVRIRRLERQPAAVRHRVTSVYGEVQDSVLELIRVDLGEP